MEDKPLTRVEIDQWIKDAANPAGVLTDEMVKQCAKLDASNPVKPKIYQGKEQICKVLGIKQKD